MGLAVGAALGYLLTRLNLSNEDIEKASGEDIGRVSGGIVGFFAGVVLWGTVAQLIAEDLGGGDLGVLKGICVAISLCIGSCLFMLVGANIGRFIGEKWL